MGLCFNLVSGRQSKIQKSCGVVKGPPQLLQLVLAGESVK
jgi:hypothetical protein